MPVLGGPLGEAGGLLGAGEPPVLGRDVVPELPFDSLGANADCWGGFASSFFFCCCEMISAHSLSTQPCKRLAALVSTVKSTATCLIRLTGIGM